MPLSASQFKKPAEKLGDSTHNLYLHEYPIMIDVISVGKKVSHEDVVRGAFRLSNSLEVQTDFSLTTLRV